jgi:DNA-binding response OmpR family regulator
VAEDNEQMSLLMSIHLEAAGYEVVRCGDGLELVQHMGTYELPDPTRAVHLIISDIRMPILSGLEVLEGIGDREDIPPVILITAFGDEETHDQARQLGAVACLDKPFAMEDLVAMVRELVPVKGPA